MHFFLINAVPLFDVGHGSCPECVAICRITPAVVQLTVSSQDGSSVRVDSERHLRAEERRNYFDYYQQYEGGNYLTKVKCWGFPC